MGLPRKRLIWLAATTAIALSEMVGQGAAHAEAIKLLLPAPLVVPAFAPFVVAKRAGYYEKAGLEVSFIVAKGGVDVAKQVGVGNADLGDALGETPIIVRGNGIPIKDVALLGNGALTIVVARNDRGIRSLKDLKGKAVSVMSYEDTTYFALLGALSTIGLTKSDLKIEAVGPGAITNLVVAGTVDACACTPDWEVLVKTALPDAVSFPAVDYFPSMGQAIVASDDAIAKRPAMIAAFVKASLEGMRDTMADPARAAHYYAQEVPSFADKEETLTKYFKAYDQRTYYGQAKLGVIDPARLEKVEKLYLDNGFIKTATPVDQLYTNQFVGNVDAPAASGAMQSPPAQK